MTHTFFFSYYLALCSIPRDGPEFPVLYSRTLLLLHSTCNSLHLPTPNSQSLLPLPWQPQVCFPWPWSVSFLFVFFAVEFYELFVYSGDQALVSCIIWKRFPPIQYVVRMRKANTKWYHLNLELNIWHKWPYLQKRNSWTWRKDLWLSRGRGRKWGGLGICG